MCARSERLRAKTRSIIVGILDSGAWENPEATVGIEHSLSGPLAFCLEVRFSVTKPLLRSLAELPRFPRLRNLGCPRAILL
jgi:hypothetical protein